MAVDPRDVIGRLLHDMIMRRRPASCTRCQSGDMLEFAIPYGSGGLVTACRRCGVVVDITEMTSSDLARYRQYYQAVETARISSLPTPKKVVRPSASWLLVVLRFACSVKTVDELFMPTIDDLRIEHAKTVGSGEFWKARWILARGYWSIWAVAWASCGAKAVKIIVRIWKVV